MTGGVPALMLMVPVGLYRGLAPVVGDFSPDLVRLMAWSETIGHSLLAWGFVLAVVQASFFAGSALKRLTGRIAGNPDAAGLRAIVADASTTRRSNWRSGSTAATTSSTRAASRSPAPRPATGAPRLPSHARATMSRPSGTTRHLTPTPAHACREPSDAARARERGRRPRRHADDRLGPWSRHAAPRPDPARRASRGEITGQCEPLVAKAGLVS